MTSAKYYIITETTYGAPVCVVNRETGAIESKSTNGDYSGVPEAWAKSFLTACNITVHISKRQLEKNRQSI